MVAFARHMQACIRKLPDLSQGPHRRLASLTPHKRLVLLGMSSVLLLSGCMLSPLFQAPGLIMTGIAMVLGLAACGGGGGGGGGSKSTGGGTVTYPTIISLKNLTSSLGFAIGGTETSYGSFVSSGRDVNGDGIADILIGTPYNWVGCTYTHAGAAFVVFGDKNIGKHGWTLSSPLNFFDLEVGSPYGFAMASYGNSGALGTSVALAPDVNGDNISDIVLGQPGWRACAPSYQAATWVVFGNQTTQYGTVNLGGMSSTQGFKIGGWTNQYGGYRQGLSVAAVDLNGDGLADVVTTTPYSQQHYAYVSCGVHTHTYYDQGVGVVFGTASNTYSGGSPIGLNTLTSVKGTTFGTGPTISSRDNYYYNRTGTSVAALGDVNGDGRKDLIVGAPDATGVYNGSYFSDAGVAYVLFGGTGGEGGATPTSPAQLNGTNGFRITQTYSNYYTGTVVAGLGDVNGDGIPDIAVVNKYGVYVLFGHSSGNPWSSTVNMWNEVKNSNGFFVSLSGVYATAVTSMDINGDGVDDLIIGDASAFVYSGYSNGHNGAVFVVFGGSHLAGAELEAVHTSGSTTTIVGGYGFALVGPNRTYIGQSLAVGDVNGDGHKDLVIGSGYYDYYDGDPTVFVIFGLSSSDTNFPSYSVSGTLKAGN